MQRHEYANCDTPRREIPQNFRLDELELNALLEIRIGGHLGVKSPKDPQRGTPAKSSNSNRKGDTEPAPVNRFARAVTQTTWFVIGQFIRGLKHPAISYCAQGTLKTPKKPHDIGNS
jgi:hypothetical protein